VDNITHSLAGLLLANAIVQVRASRTSSEGPGVQSGFSTTAAAVGVIGANLPDIDVPWHGVLQGLGLYDDLQLLLHHRGWTHTLLGALLGTLMLWGAGGFLLRRTARSTSATDPRPDQRWLLVLCTVAVLSHVLLDFTNDYGVHPLSPFSHQWFHGDTVFIIEPWLWVMAVPALMRATTRRATQMALVTVLVIGAVLSALAPQMSLAATAVAATGLCAALLLMPRLTPARATATGIGGWIVVTLLFAAGTGAVRTRVAAVAASGHATGTEGGAYRLFDVIVSPSPSNPFCARAITVQANDSKYLLTTAWAAAAPALVSAAWCERAAHTDTTTGAQHLKMRRVRIGDSPAIAWGWSWTAPRSDLAALMAAQCQIAAWSRFVRAPFWVDAGPDSVLVGDLRYDRDRGMRVSRFTFPRRAENCPASVPPWTRPRNDIWPERSS
jgi:inner membrane protein